MAYDNTNSGVLFRNTRKEEGDKRPDYNGNLDINGLNYDLVAWLQESKKGTKYLRLKATLKEDETSQDPSNNTPF